MTTDNIKYIPDALKYRLLLNSGRRSLRGRDGVMVIEDKGESVSRTVGFIPDLDDLAKQHLLKNPSHNITIQENSCGLSGDPLDGLKEVK